MAVREPGLNEFADPFDVIEREEELEKSEAGTTKEP